MLKQQIQVLNQHCQAVEHKIREGNDSQLLQLVSNLQLYLTTSWHRDLDDREAEQAAARLIAAAHFACDCLVSPSLIEWLANSLTPPLRSFLEYAYEHRPELPQSTQNALPSQSSPGEHLFEHFLHQVDPAQRRRAGVFYTPRPIARFIVARVHQLLQTDFNLADGLADVSTAEPFVNLVDPAVGTGVFLVESIELVHETMVRKWRAAGLMEAEIRRRWNSYVSEQLLPRLMGIDLMPAPCLLAALNITLKLAETGCDFQARSRINLHVADSLAGPFAPGIEYSQLPRAWQLAAREANRACYESAPTVVIGNPPYAALSNSTSRWIEGLIRGRLPGNEKTNSYYELDGRPLEERKLWLHDDYVKFMRFGQWKIDTAGAGILAFITNHGYLDNPTFRGMRQQLLSAFSSISLIDLHGSAKKKETSIDGRPDQNVFDVEQGISIGLFLKTPTSCAGLQPGNRGSRSLEAHAPGCEAEVSYADIWGTREEKYAWLETRAAADLESGEDNSVPAAQRLQPAAPYYFFVPRDHSLDEEYETGFSLTEIMPVNTSAIVTARDSFVIAMQHAELVSRLEQFRDLTISDDEIRTRYFGNTRSRRYPRGDTRGWKLAEARRRVAADDNWQSRIGKCLYRPFDTRYIFWSDDMIDWPRLEVSRHLVGHDNLVLIARRQMLPTQPCRYFWIADQLVLDGVIRSDNRGNESLFPLYLYEGGRRANLQPEFIESLSQRLAMDWRGDGCGDLESTFGPEDVVHYVYAMFHSSEYRVRYANQLRISFPRVFLPADVGMFRALCSLGGELVSHHLAQQSGNAVGDQAGSANQQVEPGYPKHLKNRVHVNASFSFSDVPPEVWNFHAGGHRVCRKWLKDRRGRGLTSDEFDAYPRIINAIKGTLDLTNRIDTLISESGGWQRAVSRKR